MGRPALPPGEHARFSVVNTTPKAGESPRADYRASQPWRAQTRYRPLDGSPSRVLQARGTTARIATAALEKVVRERLDAERHGTDGTPVAVTRSTTVTELINVWLAQERRDQRRRPQTLDKYASAAKTHLQLGSKRRHRGDEESDATTTVPRRVLIGGDRVTSVTPARVAAVLDHLTDAVPAQAKVARAILNASFDLAVRNGVIETNPVAQIKTRRRGASTVSRKPRPATPAEVELFRTEAVRDAERNAGRGNDWLVPLVDVLWSTGLRVSEALALHVDSVELTDEGAWITIEATIVEYNDGRLLRQPMPKSAQGFRRVEVLLPRGVHAIHRLVDASRRAGRQHLFASRITVRRDGTTIGGGYLGKGGVGRVWHRLALRAGLIDPSDAPSTEQRRPWTVHSVRKLVADSIERNDSLEAAAAFLGHDEAVTSAHYLERNIRNVETNSRTRRRVTESLDPSTKVNESDPFGFLDDPAE